MTTYNNKHYNNKTRKIKLFKGGALEDDIKNAAIDKVKSVTSTGPGSGSPATGPGSGPGSAPGTGPATAPGPDSSVPVKSGKKVSILIDFYKKLLKPENYGNKLNFNKFYEIINVNQNEIDMTETITGVEELFEIFKNELEYIKANNDDKETKKKALSSNHEKTKKITIEYKNGDYTITGPSGPVTTITPGSTTRPTTTPGSTTRPTTPTTTPTTTPVSIEENIKNTAINVLKSNVEPIIITGNIQETAKNTVFDAVIKELVKSDLDENSLVSNFKLEKLYDEIAKLTKKINENNDNIKTEKNNIKKYSTDLEKFKKIENNYNSQKLNDKSKQEKLSILKARNNVKIKVKITDIEKSITNIITTLAKNTLINNLLLPLNSEKEYYLNLLDRAYDILTKELSSVEGTVSTLGVILDKRNKKIFLDNMQKIRNKIYKLTHKTWMNRTKDPNISNTSSSAIIPETAITKAAIKAVNDVVNPANP